jgi:uncharacterized protein YjbJ (UPF0337 family)
LKEPFAPDGYNEPKGKRWPAPLPPGGQFLILNPKKPMNTQIIKGNWDIAKGKLKQKYAKLTDNDLRFVDGKEDELIGRLEKATGERREVLEKFLNDERNYR